MKQFVALLVLVLFGCQTPQVKGPTTFQVKSDTVQVLGYLTDETLEEPMRVLKRMGMITAAAKEKPNGVPPVVEVYIHSLEGDPEAVEKLIRMMSPLNTVCYADLAGGPAFTLLQSCSYRIVSPLATVGQSEYTVSVEDVAASKAARMIESVKVMQERSVDIEAGRMGFDKDAYRQMVAKEGFVWSNTLTIMGAHAADASFELTCSDRSRTEKMYRAFSFSVFNVNLLFTQCPRDRQYLGRRYPSQVFQWFGVPFAEPVQDEPTLKAIK